MIDLVSRLPSHFDRLQDRFACFAKYGVQVEGWFKGELLAAVDQMHGDPCIVGLDREVVVGTKRIDFMFDLSSGRHWVELKSWLIEEQGGTRYGPRFYFLDRTSVGIVKDVEKLLQIEGPGRRWLLILLTANPGSREWDSGLHLYCKKFHHDVVSWSTPSGFPESYFLGLLEVRGGSLNSNPICTT